MERPFFTTVKDYSQRFMDADYWKPYILAIGARHGLKPCREIRAGFPGTFPVFIVDEQYVIKLFGNLFQGGDRFATELAMYEAMMANPTLPTPALVASGALFPEGDGWHWPYLITRKLPGKSLSEAEQKVPYPDRLALCRWLGPVVRHIHELEPTNTSLLERNWNNFDRFLAKQRHTCVAQHRRWGALPTRLIEQIDAYLPPLDELIDHSLPPHVLHCDLNTDHILGTKTMGHWRPSGIIDFGDAMVGDRIYELVALHIGLFHSDTNLLQTFLQAYNFDAELKQNFVRRAMSMTLLHEFNVLGEICADYPIVEELPTLEAFAELLWNPESSGLTGCA